MTRISRASMFDLASRSWNPVRTWEEQEVEELERAAVPTPRVHRAAASSALNTAIQPPWAGAAFTLSTLFAALRAEGITPHGVYENPLAALSGAQMDEAVAELLLAALATAPRGVTEKGITPSPVLGVEEGSFPRVDPTNAGQQAPEISQFGNYIDMVADLARMGAGRIRRAQQCDIYWASLFPYHGNTSSGDFYEYGERVPDPARMLQLMRADATGRIGGADGYAALGWATGLVVACLCFGIKLDLTPFNAGGGASQNLGEGNIGSVGPTDYVPLYGAGTPASYSSILWLDVVAGKPPWQAGLLVPSGAGWDASYLPSKPSAYQQLVVNVWPISDDESQGAYTAEECQCARRKCFGVLAYSTGIGEWLQKIDRALTAVGASIYDVVEIIELCNETSGFFYKPPTPMTFAVADLGLLEASAREAGRYFALLAGPIRSRLPQMRFRTEIGSFGVVSSTTAGPRPDTYAAELKWLKRVLELGIVEEAERWRALEVARAASALGVPIDPTAADWFRDEAWAGMNWPPTGKGAGSAPAATGLVHQIGVHWFHDHDHTSLGHADPWGYADAVRLQADIAAMQDVITGLRRRVGYDLRPVMMAVNFPSVDPGSGQVRAASYFGTNETLQAAVLTRNIATLLASGGESAGIYNFCKGVTDNRSTYGQPPSFSSFQSFSTDGIHNDVLYGATRGRTFLQEVDCWPRAVWYAFRRFLWLYARVDRIPGPQMFVLESARGLSVLGLRFASALAIGPDGQRFLRGPWRWAYLAWLDQYANSADVHADPRLLPAATLEFADPSRAPLTGRAASLFEVLPVIPVLNQPGRSLSLPWGAPNVAAGAPINGYAQSGAAPDWTWPGYASALDRAAILFGSLRLDIRRCDPTVKDRTRSALAPLCILTNLDYVRSS